MSSFNNQAVLPHLQNEKLDDDDSRTICNICWDKSTRFLPSNGPAFSLDGTPRTVCNSCFIKYRLKDPFTNQPWTEDGPWYSTKIDADGPIPKPCTYCLIQRPSCRIKLDDDFYYLCPPCARIVREYRRKPPSEQDCMNGCKVETWLCDIGDGQWQCLNCVKKITWNPKHKQRLMAQRFMLKEALAADTVYRLGIREKLQEAAEKIYLVIRLY